jgi:hypothetical protein
MLCRDSPPGEVAAGGSASGHPCSSRGTMRPQPPVSIALQYPVHDDSHSGLIVPRLRRRLRGSSDGSGYPWWGQMRHPACSPHTPRCDCVPTIRYELVGCGTRCDLDGRYLCRICSSRASDGPTKPCDHGRVRSGASGCRGLAHRAHVAASRSDAGPGLGRTRHAVRSSGRRVSTAKVCSH